jgi:hypothetical protein
MRLCTTAFCSLWVAVAALGWNASACAAESHTVVVVEPDRDDAVLQEVFSRMCGELHMYGWQTTIVEGGASAEPLAQTLAASQASGAVAAVALVREAGVTRADMWIAAESAERSNPRITVSGDEKEAPNLLAIRAADVLRSTLLYRGRAESPRLSEKPAAPPKSETTTASLTEKRSASPGPTAVHGPSEPWRLGAAVAVVSDLGGLGTGMGPCLNLERHWPNRWAIGVLGVGPVVGQTVSNDNGSASLQQALGFFTLMFRLAGEERLVLHVFQGFGVAHWAVHGEAKAPWAAKDSSGWFAAAATGLRARLTLSRHMGLSLAVAALFLRPSPVVDLADQSYRATQPLPLATAGLDAQF